MGRALRAPAYERERAEDRADRALRRRKARRGDPVKLRGQVHGARLPLRLRRGLLPARRARLSRPARTLRRKGAGLERAAARRRRGADAPRRGRRRAREFPFELRDLHEAARGLSRLHGRRLHRGAQRARAAHAHEHLRPAADELRGQRAGRGRGRLGLSAAGLRRPRQRTSRPICGRTTASSSSRGTSAARSCCGTSFSSAGSTRRFRFP